MIVYSLRCGNGHRFDGWFKNRAAYEAQAAGGELSCPVCGSDELEKHLSAPNIPAKSNRKPEETPQRPAAETGRQAVAGGGAPAADMMGTLRALRRHVEENFENVGPRFADEARKIHYGEVPERGIYGEATKDEVAALGEEGIETAPLPKDPDKLN